MNNFLFLASFLTISLMVSAQTSTIRGQIVEQKMGETVKVELLGGSIFVFQQSEIDSIKKEKVLASKTAKRKEDYYRKDKGYRNITEIGLICGFGNNGSSNSYYYGMPQNDYGFSLHTVNGYQFNRFIYIGGGIGIDRFITYKQSFAPFYVRAASEFLKKRVTPYVFADVGYSHMLRFHSDEWTQGKNKGGIYHTAGAGVRIYTRSKASVLFGISYKRNTSQTTWQYSYEGSPVYKLNRSYQRVVFNVGVTF
jgi:hypothetical protein